MSQSGSFEPPPVPGQSRPRRTSFTVIAVLGVVVAVLVGVVGFLLWRTPTAAASDVMLEPTNVATVDSFMPAQGPDASVEAPTTRPGGAVQGSTPGLFGGTEDNASCDQGRMSQFLESHQDKAAAWAEAQGIRSGDIPAYVRELTPLVLRADTYVTNHGFRAGELTSYPAVLQAGTAVLVDGHGTPRVKCFCGNPVSAPPQYRPAQFAGRPWAGFAPVTVIIIQPAPVVIENLTVVNIRNNVVYNVILPPWRWGPSPGTATSSSTGTSSGGTSSSSTSPATTTAPTPTSSTTTASIPESGDRSGPTTTSPDCEPSDAAGVSAGTTTIPSTTPSTCTTTPTTTTTTETTTTETTETTSS